MRYTRQLLRAAQDASVATGNAIPAPKYWEPASKAPSPIMHMVIGTGVGLVFAGYYKVRAVDPQSLLSQSGPLICGTNVVHATVRKHMTCRWHTGPGRRR
jgi:hypothetical protein